MRDIHFLVLRHSRLNFLKAGAVAEDFIRQRLAHAGVQHIHIIERDALQNELKNRIPCLGENLLAVLDIMNPMVDLELVNQMAERLRASSHHTAHCDGAIPGTQIESLLSKDSSTNVQSSKKYRGLLVRSTNQDQHNNQFNLYKYKRLKLFLFLVKSLPDMQTLTIPEFIDSLEQDDIFNRLAAFGEQAEVHVHKDCPHCHGRINPLPMRMSQPFCGYLPANRPLYHECDNCGLIVVSPFVTPSQTHLLYDKFDHQDFVVTINNPYNSGTPRCDFTEVLPLLPDTPKTLDIGGGMGGFSKHLKKKFPGWDVTHADFSLNCSAEIQSHGITTRAINFLKEPIGNEAYDLITAWEVLEHVPYDHLKSVLENIHMALAPGGVFMFSTPDFDSPLCQSMDFFAICPPFHYLVFGRHWLKNFFAAQKKWRLYPMRACSDFLDDAAQWYDYAAKTSPSFQLRATADILGTILSDSEYSAPLKRTLLEKGYGTEIIVMLQKE